MGASRSLVGRLSFEGAAGVLLGDRRIRLLEAIALHGSLNRAAQAVPLSYKAAWDALDEMNNLAEAPLVVRTTGGAGGGGTRLTEHGRRLVALYRAMESSQQDLLDRVSSPRALAAAVAASNEDAGALRTLLRRMSMRTSARNQFAGTVLGVRTAGGLSHVRLHLEGDEELVAAITPESAETMALRPGSAAYALVKAPWVRITATAPRRSALRNVYAGTIAQVQSGAARLQVVLTTAGGRSIAASMAKVAGVDGTRRMKVGDAAWAGFATESVILATFD